MPSPRKSRLLAVLLLLLSVALFGGTARAQPSQRCFPETGQCIAGPIRAYWERNGGLAIFGYPITPQQTETVEGTWTGPTQWFERDRLEDHSGEGQGVLAGRLGARFLELSNTPWQAFPAARDYAGGCQFFAETGHSLCEPFESYWRANGGLERFGFSRHRNLLRGPGGPQVRGAVLRAPPHGAAPRAARRPDPAGLAWPLRARHARAARTLPRLPPKHAAQPAQRRHRQTPRLPRARATRRHARGDAGLRARRDAVDRHAQPPGASRRAFPRSSPSSTLALFCIPSTTPGDRATQTPRQTRRRALASTRPTAASAWCGPPTPICAPPSAGPPSPRPQARTADIQLFDKALIVRINETGQVFAFGDTNTPTDAQIVAP